MAKQSGLGDLFLISGVDISGDIAAIDELGGGLAAVDEVSGIDVSGKERIGLGRDGRMNITTFFNPARAHLTLNDLPTTDVIAVYGRGRSIGSPGACINGKQATYDGSREASGAYRLPTQILANSYGLEWGRQLTAGLRTDTTATNGASLDQTTVSTLFGWQAYLQVTAFSGTNVTVVIEDSADDVSFAALSGASFTAVSSAPAWQRLESASRTATVRRYVRAVTTGTFTSATFAVVFVRNDTSVVF